MASNRFQKIHTFGSPYDLARQLGENGIAKILEIVCEAYVVLQTKHLVKKGMTEDEITEELVSQTECIWRKSSVLSSIVPMNQKIDRTLAKNRGRPPTIDFCFRHVWVKEAFFGFECKRLAEGNSALSQEYVDNGLCRYLRGEYCSSGSAGSMIGYVTSGSLVAIIRDIKTRVDNERAVNAMTLAFSIGLFKEHYVSTHTRERGLSQFSVHHLFFSFAESN